jgi:hypothetical protein
MTSATEEHNVLLPVAYDWVLSAVMLAAVVLALVALVHLARRKDYSATETALWALLVLVAPILGPGFYLLTQRTGRDPST